MKLLVALPMIMIVISLIFTALPFQFDSETLNQQLPITIGAVVFTLFGEAIIWMKKIKKKGVIYHGEENQKDYTKTRRI